MRVGTDTYGRVKTVFGTPIVTKFGMIYCLPVYPLQSYYRTGTTSEVTTIGVPFVATAQSVEVKGIPLSSVDTASVVMAYSRGLFGVLTIFGCMLIVPGIMYLTGEQLDDFAKMMVRGLLVSLAVGTVGGLLTYAIPLTPAFPNLLAATFLLGSGPIALIGGWIGMGVYYAFRPPAAPAPQSPSLMSDDYVVIEGRLTTTPARR